MRSGDTDGVGCEIDRQIDRVTGLDEDCFSDIPESYTRYLRRGLATALHWEHLPVVIEYKKADNPFDQ